LRLSPRQGGRYDNGEDRSSSPGPSGPRVVSSEIKSMLFLARFQPPSNLKYSGEMNHVLWLEDYRLACQTRGVNDDLFIIRNLPHFLADTT